MKVKCVKVTNFTGHNATMFREGGIYSAKLAGHQGSLLAVTDRLGHIRYVARDTMTFPLGSNMQVSDHAKFREVES